MSLEIPRIQAALAAEKLDGWLLYDFRGTNAIAEGLVGLTGQHVTRRWFYFIPTEGSPKKLNHAIESHKLDALPGEKTIYAGRGPLVEGLKKILGGAKTIAMEYSANNDIPYISRVDAGTIELIRSMGITVVSSGDLVGQFEAAWNDAEIGTHRRASEALYRIKDRTFAYVQAKMQAGIALNEYVVQQEMVRFFGEEGLIADSAPIVGAQENAGDPHYAPSKDVSRAINPGEVLLLDLWGKLPDQGAVYADITWCGFTGETPTDKIAKAFATIVAGRDAAINKVQSGIAAGRDVRGYEVDRVCRDVIAAAGYGEYFVHRTGHSLGIEVHGNGVHMDDYETRDDRKLLNGTGFTIEPGIYTKEFGVRTEINMVVGARSATVTGPCQSELVVMSGVKRHV
jgi:Xaa-Pro aminopeptidase